MFVCAMSVDEIVFFSDRARDAVDHPSRNNKAATVIRSKLRLNACSLRMGGDLGDREEKRLGL